MTERINIKLNKNLFRPLLDELKELVGKEFFDNDNDLVAKSVFFTYLSIKDHNWRFLHDLGKDPKSLIYFLDEYRKFKR